ncbi:hypothetical protein ACERII_00565 [Evansella sp. AB-rgal1]|uniref:hypothetical protein n=1 Tax=Evansella sp. AB-rgal1 TaxID=3242696 RepID=UPI00359DAD4F
MKMRIFKKAKSGNAEEAKERAEVVKQLMEAKKQGKVFITDKGEKVLNKWS